MREEGKKEGMEIGFKQGVEKGIEKGTKETLISTAKNMKDKNIDVELISEITGLSIDEIYKL